MSPRQPGRDPFVALRNDEGRPVGVVTWSPPSLGLVALGRAMPVIVVAALIYLIVAAVSISRGYASLRQLGWQVMADSLSRLPNRRALRWEMIRRGDSREEAGLAILDLDGFKMVNDSFGHETGDQLIKAVAALLKQAAGTDATAIRLGGDEFALLATGEGAGARIEEVIQRLLLMLDAPVVLMGRPVQVGASVGIVKVRLGDLSPSEAMRRADAAMYVAKRSGKKRVVFYSPELEQEHLAAAKLTGDLRKAIEARDFTVQYQPMIDCRTGHVVSVEALLRWPHAELGTISARDFINVADQAGLTVPIGTLAMDQIAKDAQDWEDVRLAVNLSRGQLRSPGFLSLLEAQLKALQIAPERMEFEIREELFVENADFAEEIAAELRQMGCRLVLDNFGSGFAAFNTLERANFAKVKIDTGLVSRAASDDRALVLLQSCVAVAHSHGARAVAQGVETFAQAELMRIIGCDEIQGWTYGRPISAADVTSLLSVRTLPDPAATPAAYDEDRPLFELERVSG
jgi:diguanylate cyclase (GGDEF)-like protein